MFFLVPAQNILIITSNLPRGTYRTSRHISFQDLQAKGAQILFVSSKSE